MIQNLPLYISLLFGITVVISIGWFYHFGKSKLATFLIIDWAILQSVLALNGVYEDTMNLPAKIMVFGVLPTILIIISMFVLPAGKIFIEKINLKSLTNFHSIRIAVEVVLSLLFHYGYVSKYMTFEGTNFDILSGISALIVAYIAFKHTAINRKLLLIWNGIALLLLLNVVITAIFALPTAFQKLAFDQPNIAILFFPFVLLPTLLVPMVLFGHLVAIKRLWKKSI